MKPNIGKKLLFFSALLIFCSVFSGKVRAASATLKLFPTSGTYEVGDAFELQIKLDTGGARTSGTDIYLLYDPTKLEVQDITPGTLYSQYVGEDINNQNGGANLSGLVSGTSDLFEGIGTFATIMFRTLSPGVAEVSFDFTPGDRNDCNVADFDTQDDTLASVTNGSYNIAAGAGAPPTPTPAGGVGGGAAAVTSPTPAPVPVTASLIPTLFLGLTSLLSIILGISLLLF